MKNSIALITCLCVVLSVLVFRAVVHKQYAVGYPAVGTGAASAADEKEILQLHFHERRPYNIKHKDDVYGLVASPVSRALAESHINFRWIETPAGRQLDMIRANRSAICSPGWFKTPQRQRYAQFTSPVYQDNSFVAVTKADNRLLSPDDLLNRVLSERRLKLLVKSGYSYGNFIDQKLDEFRPWQLTTTADNEGMLEMILDQRADYCFMTEEEASDLLFFSSLDSTDFKIIRFADMLEGNKRYLICSKKVKKEVMDRMNTAINQFIKIPENY